MKNARVYELKGSLYLFKAKILQYHDCVVHKTIIEKYKLEHRPLYFKLKQSNLRWRTLYKQRSPRIDISKRKKILKYVEFRLKNNSDV